MISFRDRRLCRLIISVSGTHCHFERLFKSAEGPFISPFLELIQYLNFGFGKLAHKNSCGLSTRDGDAQHWT